MLLCEYWPYRYALPGSVFLTLPRKEMAFLECAIREVMGDSFGDNHCIFTVKERPDSPEVFICCRDTTMSICTSIQNNGRGTPRVFYPPRFVLLKRDEG